MKESLPLTPPSDVITPLPSPLPFISLMNRCVGKYQHRDRDLQLGHPSSATAY
jgi:hypothetical protein